MANKGIKGGAVSRNVGHAQGKFLYVSKMLGLRVHESLCGRTDDLHGFLTYNEAVTCKFCLKKMAKGGVNMFLVLLASAAGAAIYCKLSEAELAGCRLEVIKAYRIKG